VLLWHEKQLSDVVAWLNEATVHVVVTWHDPHSSSVVMWFVPLPVTRAPEASVTAPLWQLVQVPRTCVWSTRAYGCHDEIVWQLSQAAVDWMWPSPLPEAETPWQVAQFPTKPVWSGRPFVTHVSGEWQFSQTLELWTCVGDLYVMSTPVEVLEVPLWQV
jgi:hypothetical protein